MEGRWQKKSLLQRNGRGAAPLLGRKRSRLSGARRSRARRQRRAGGRRRRRRRRSSSEDSWSPKTQTGRRLPVACGALEARVFQRSPGENRHQEHWQEEPERLMVLKYRREVAVEIVVDQEGAQKSGVAARADHVPRQRDY